MKRMILTNNPTILQELDVDCAIVFMPTLPALLTHCLSLLDQGWALLMDPMAGYLSRPNPFHTLLLILPGADGACRRYLQDVMAIDKLLSRYWLLKDQYAFHATTAKRRADHAAVDRAIFLRAFDNIQKSERF